MPHLLVTGFGPFPTMPRNPSAALARRVAASPRWRLLGSAAEALILTTAYGALAAELDPSLAHGPDGVLMIGVAGRSKRVRVERRATSRRSTLFPDVDGRRADRPSGSAGPPARRTVVPPVRALRSLRAHGVPSRISHDAGRYLCNASYFRALARPVPVLFVHIPKPPRLARSRTDAPRDPRPPEARLAQALVEIGLTMLRDARVAGRRALG